LLPQKGQTTTKSSRLHSLFRAKKKSEGVARTRKQAEQNAAQAYMEKLGAKPVKKR
jgi:dsRNA-specific ribonuclease